MLLFSVPSLASHSHLQVSSNCHHADPNVKRTAFKSRAKLLLIPPAFPGSVFMLVVHLVWQIRPGLPTNSLLLHCKCCYLFDKLYNSGIRLSSVRHLFNNYAIPSPSNSISAMITFGFVERRYKCCSL